MDEATNEGFPEIPGYHVLELIGGGGMATIYLARQDKFEREVALKIMEPRLLKDPTFGQRFISEARIVAQLTHPNFLPVYDVGQCGDNHYMSMEYVPGGDLQELLADGLSLPYGFRIIRDVARGLSYAAQKNFVHRDIKPGNILLRADNSAVICDFGIARDANSDTRMTETGVLIGTPKYMSPEQIHGRELDGRSDLYSLGVIAFEMFTGRLPFVGESALATSIMHLNSPIPELDGELKVFQPFIDKALAKEPDERFQTGEEMVQALAELEAEHYELIHSQPDTVQMSEDAIQSAVSHHGRKKRTTTRRSGRPGANTLAGKAFFLLVAGTLVAAGLWWSRSPLVTSSRESAAVAGDATIERLNRQVAELEWKAGAALAQDNIRDRDYLAARRAIDALEDSGADAALVGGLRQSLSREQEQDQLEHEAKILAEQAEQERLVREQAEQKQLDARQAEQDRLAREEAKRAELAREQQRAVAAQNQKQALAKKSRDLHALAAAAISQRDFDAAQAQLNSLRQLDPSSTAGLQRELDAALGKYNEALQLLQQADTASAAPFRLEREPGSNRKVRQSLRDAFANIEAARKLDAQCPQLPESVDRLGDSYAHIINTNLQAGELDTARRFLDDFAATGLFAAQFTELEQTWSAQKKNTGRGKINIPSF